MVKLHVMHHVVDISQQGGITPMKNGLPKNEPVMNNLFPGMKLNHAMYYKIRQAYLPLIQFLVFNYIYVHTLNGQTYFPDDVTL